MTVFEIAPLQIDSIQKSLWKRDGNGANRSVFEPVSNVFSFGSAERRAGKLVLVELRKAAVKAIAKIHNIDCHRDGSSQLKQQFLRAWMARARDRTVKRGQWQYSIEHNGIRFCKQSQSQHCSHDDCRCP